MEREPDRILKFTAPMFGELSVSPTMDVIKRYDEEQFDHLQYLDDERGKITFLFLGKVVLNGLAELGVPEAFHDTLYESVSEHYEDYLEMLDEMGKLAAEHSMDPTDIPEEPVPEEEFHLSDAEINWYMGEWNE